MIEPMKKVAVLMSAATRGPSLEDLRRLGIVHLQHGDLPPSPSPLVGEGRGGGDERLHLEENLQLLRDVLALAPSGSAIPPKLPLSKEGTKPLSAEQAAEGLAIAADWLALRRELPRRQGELAALRRRRESQVVLGRFDPQDILKLREAGVFVRLYACSRRDWKTYSKHPGVERIAARGSTVYLACVSRDEQDRLPLREMTLPDSSLDELEARIAASERALAETRGRIEKRVAQASLLRASQLHFLNARRLAQARAALSGDEQVACLQGFCPAARVAELSRHAAEKGWGLVVAEPTEDDPTPTLLRNSRFTALFQPVMDFLRVLPGYHEFDTNGLFLIFFTLFFAMILGDAGYGLLLLAATFVASRCFPAIPRRTLPLIYLLSAATVIWGAMSGLWFGVPQLAQLPGLRSLVVPSFNAFVTDNEATLIWLCLTLGVVHLTLAHLWAAWRHRSLQSLADLGWMLVVWAAYVAAVGVLVGEGRLSVAITLAAGGLVGVVLFGEQTGGSFVRGVGRGVLNLPLNLLTAISSFSDMVSYLRLFAIGLATKEVAVAFNRLALEVGFDDVVAALGAALLVVLGHSVNLLLGALGVVVHGLRLNLLEFSRHLNVTWSGIPYEPFRFLTATDLDPASSGAPTPTNHP
jgi:V/A-type H+-transporting ATPase subunit I